MVNQVAYLVQLVENLNRKILFSINEEHSIKQNRWLNISPETGRQDFYRTDTKIMIWNKRAIYDKVSDLF